LFKEVPVRREITKQIALSKDDIDQLSGVDLSNNSRLERVRDIFLVGCYTGMRYSDFKRIKASNVSDNLITIREVKDKSKTLQIPITDRVRDILDKYNMELPVISEQKFRDYLKEVFKLAGFTKLSTRSKKIGKRVYEEEVPMYELISTHTARRSFITIMLNSGVPDKAIMKITGHKSINNFQVYYRPSNEVLSDFMSHVWS
jgi:integrase